LSGGAKKPEYRIKDELIRASVIDVMIQYRNVPKRVMGVRSFVNEILVIPVVGINLLGVGGRYLQSIK
jgi:hypothetical protein